MSLLAIFGRSVGFVTVRVFFVNLYLCEYVGSCLCSVFVILYSLSRIFVFL